MEAGKLRHRVVFQEKSATQNALGEEVITWLPVTAAWAQVETLSGREYIEQARSDAELTHKVTIRHRAGLRPEMRIDFGGRIFEIGAIVEDNRKRLMTFLCSEDV